jgi:chromosome segregation ATPase
MVSKETLVLYFSAAISSSAYAAFKKVSSSIQGIEQKLEKVNSAARKIREFRELKRGLAELRLKMRAAGSAGRSLTAEFREQAHRLKELREELKKAGIDVKRLAAQEKHLARVGKLLEKQKISLKKASAAGERRRAAFEELDTVLAPAMTIAAPVMLSVNYQKALAEVSTLTNLTAKELQKKYGAAVLKLSRELGASPTEVVKAMYQAISSGIAPKEAIEFLRQAGKAAIAGVTDVFTR